MDRAAAAPPRGAQTTLASSGSLTLGRTLPAWGENLLGNLLGSLDEQLPLLAEALDQADLAEAANIAHRLSGSCHSMGLVALGAGLGELEREALGAAGVDPRAWGARLGSLRRDGAEALRRAGFLGEADSAAG